MAELRRRRVLRLRDIVLARQQVRGVRLLQAVPDQSSNCKHKTGTHFTIPFSWTCFKKLGHFTIKNFKNGQAFWFSRYENDW